MWLSLICDGPDDETACPGGAFVGPADTEAEAVELARAAGWTFGPDGADDVADTCPSCMAVVRARA